MSACGLDCSSFDFAEALVCLFIFSVGLFVALLSNSMTGKVLQLQVRGGIRSRNVSACIGVEHEANTCKFAIHPP